LLGFDPEPHRNDHPRAPHTASRRSRCDDSIASQSRLAPGAPRMTPTLNETRSRTLSWSRKAPHHPLIVRNRPLPKERRPPDRSALEGHRAGPEVAGMAKLFQGERDFPFGPRPRSQPEALLYQVVTAIPVVRPEAAWILK